MLLFFLEICTLLAIQGNRVQPLVFTNQEKALPADFPFQSTVYSIRLKPKGAANWISPYLFVDKNEREAPGSAGSSETHYFSFFNSRSTWVEATKFHSTATHALVLFSDGKTRKIRTTKIRLHRKIAFVVPAKTLKIAVEFIDSSDYTTTRQGLVTPQKPLLIFSGPSKGRPDAPSPAQSHVWAANSKETTSWPGKNIPSHATKIYFHPGYYRIGYFKVPPQINEIFLPPGAYVEGYLYGERTQSITIQGGGILATAPEWPFHASGADIRSPASRYDEWAYMIELQGARHHVIRDLTIAGATAYNIWLNCSDSRVENVNILCNLYNGDGITLLGENHRISDCFIRTNDDAIIHYGSGHVVEHTTFWQLNNGACIQLGWSAGSKGGLSPENPDRFQNLSVFHLQSEISESSQGNNRSFIAYSCKDQSGKNDAVVQNFLFENISFHTPIPRFLDIIAKRTEAVKSVCFENFTFKNINIPLTINHKNNLSFLKGYDKTHLIRNFQFLKVKVNGRLITSSNWTKTGISGGNFMANEFTEMPIFHP